MASTVKPKGLGYDPEYAKFRDAVGPQNLRVPIFKTALEFREFNDSFMPALWARLPAQPSITQTKIPILTLDGGTIELTRFASAAQLAAGKEQARLPAYLYFHGGGMVAEGVPYFAPLMAKLAAESGVQVFGVEYRVAPEFPAPVPAQDGLAALQWVAGHAAELGVDPARLGLMGDSAGGGLVAATALLARDQGVQPPLARLIMTCPMLDDRALCAIAPDGPLDALATVPVVDLIVCWQAYVGADKAGKPEADVSIYGAPSRAADLGNLPPTYIDVGNLDLFRDETVDFAARLAAANVDVEFHLFSGLPHGFEGAMAVPKTVEAMKARVEAMKQI